MPRRAEVRLCQQEVIVVEVEQDPIHRHPKVLLFNIEAHDILFWILTMNNNNKKENAVLFLIMFSKNVEQFEESGEDFFFF